MVSNGSRVGVGLSSGGPGFLESISHFGGRGRLIGCMSLPPFQRLLDEHASGLRRFLVGYVGWAEANDCWQETWLAALEAYPGLWHGGNLRGWLFTIARRKALDCLRCWPGTRSWCLCRTERAAAMSVSEAAASQNVRAGLARLHSSIINPVAGIRSDVGAHNGYVSRVDVGL